MAYEVPGLSLGTVDAASDLSAAANQFKFVNVTPTGIALNTTVGGNVAGILQNLPQADEPANVMHQGVTKVVAGAAIVVGAEISSDAASKAKTAVSSEFIQGIALEAAAADGDLIAVLISKAGIKA